MQITSLTQTSATFEIQPHEVAGLARELGAEPKNELDCHWIGPRTSSWWKTWSTASKVTQKNVRPAPGAHFTVEDAHLALLRRSDTEWQYMEFGAAGINPKRPYGNSNVVADIAEILGEPVESDGYSDAFIDRAYALHRETEFCLQILMAHAGIEVGATYRNDATSIYSCPVWVKVRAPRRLAGSAP